MSVQKIDYEDKIGLQNDENIPNKNKVTDEDMNEIKSKVNNNADELTTAQQNIENLQTGQGTASTDITSLKNRVTTLETDNTTNKQDINTLKADNETNKQNIANKVDKVEGKGLSTEDYTTGEKQKLAGLNNYDDTAIKEDIAEIQTEQTAQNKKIEELDDNQIHITTEKASNINVKDVSGQNAKINIYGISKQEGTPTPENRVEIENIEGDVDVTVCNKNLLNQDLELYQGNYDNSGNPVSNADKRINDYIFLNKGSYVISSNNNYWINLLIYDIDKKFLSISNSNTNKKLNFSLAEDGYIRFAFNPIVDSLTDMQIEKGTTNTEIISNEQQTITFPLAEGQKMFKGSYTADDGIHHKRKQIELDGTENWVADNQAGSDTCVGWKILVDDYVGHEGDFAPHGDILCSHFIDRNTYDNELDGISGGWGKWIFIKMKKEDLSSPDLTGFKAFLSEQKTNGTPVKIEYPLAEETIEAYTTEQQEASNQLQNAKTYKTVTNVFTENAEVEMNYVADTKTYIDNKVKNMQNQLNTINELLSTTNTSALLLNNLQTDLESEVL